MGWSNLREQRARKIDTSVTSTDLLPTGWCPRRFAHFRKRLFQQSRNAAIAYLARHGEGIRKTIERFAGLPFGRNLLSSFYGLILGLEGRNAAIKDDTRSIRKIVKLAQTSPVLTDIGRERALLNCYMMMRRDVKASKVIEKMLSRTDLHGTDFWRVIDASIAIGNPVLVHDAVARWAETSARKLSQGSTFRRFAHSTTLLNMLQSLPTLTGVLEKKRGAPHSDDQRCWFPERVVSKIVADYVPRTDFNRELIVHVTSGLGAGGAERQFVTTMTALQDDILRGAHADRPKVAPAAVVMRLTDDSSFFLPLLLRSGVAVHESSRADDFTSLDELLKAHPDSLPAVRTMLLLPPRMYTRTASLYHVLKMKKPEIVHFWQDETNILGAIAALLAGVPKIFFFTRSRRPLKFTRRRRYIRSCYRELLKLPNVGLVNNSLDGARDYERWLGMPPGSIGTIYNAVDPTTFRKANTVSAREAIKKQMALPPDARVLGGVMRTSAEKQPLLWLSVCVRLAERHPDLHFLCAGDGPFSPEMKAKAVASPYAARFHFPGAVSPVSPWMGCMDVLLQTSYIEGLPNVPIEAQCLGVPVVVTDAGGSRETVVQGVTGFVCGVNDEAGLVAACERALFDEEWRSTAKVASKENSESKFAVTAMLERLYALYSGKAVPPP